MFSEGQQLGENQSVQMQTLQPKPLLTLDRVAKFLGVTKAWVPDCAPQQPN
jgi:hypothetical protein